MNLKCSLWGSLSKKCFPRVASLVSVLPSFPMKPQKSCKFSMDADGKDVLPAFSGSQLAGGF